MKMQKFWIAAALVALCVSPAAFGQNAPASGGWRRADEVAPPDQGPGGAPPPPQQMGDISHLMLPAGTWITVRVNEELSSDRNREGDVFTATLVQPLVANGFVVARRGQTVEGRISTAERAGRSSGTSKLGFELTEVGLVDGKQAPLKTQLIQYNGGTSHGADAAAIGTGTGVGAAIGAAADGGFGAGMGAIAGAAASTLGVMLTRGRPTVVYPESELTFRITEPVSISTDGSEQAFQPVRQEDYDQRGPAPRLATRRPPPTPYYGGWGYPYPYPPYGYGYPGYYGPGLGVGVVIRTGPHYRYGRWR